MPRIGLSATNVNPMEECMIFMHGVQSFLHELIGVAAAPGSLSPSAHVNAVTYISQEVWCAVLEVLDDKFLNAADDITDEYDSYSSSLGTTEAMAVDTAASKKRRRVITPLDVSEVRRSNRSTRYLGFKAPSLSEKGSKFPMLNQG